MNSSASEYSRDDFIASDFGGFRSSTPVCTPVISVRPKLVPSISGGTFGSNLPLRSIPYRGGSLCRQRQFKRWHSVADVREIRKQEKRMQRSRTKQEESLKSRSGKNKFQNFHGHNNVKSHQVMLTCNKSY